VRICQVANGTGFESVMGSSLMRGYSQALNGIVEPGHMVRHVTHCSLAGGVGRGVKAH